MEEFIFNYENNDYCYFVCLLQLFTFRWYVTYCSPVVLTIPTSAILAFRKIFFQKQKQQ